jgi:hypothetical protein
MAVFKIVVPCRYSRASHHHVTQSSHSINAIGPVDIAGLVCSHLLRQSEMLLISCKIVICVDAVLMVVIQTAVTWLADSNCPWSRCICCLDW